MNSVPWLIDLAIEPTARADGEKFLAALTDLTIEGPSLHVSFDKESGQIILGGLSESHLESAINSLKRTFGTAFNIGAPQVAYRERLTRRVEKEYTHKKQTGGISHFANVVIVFEPNEAGAGNVFESKIVGGALPKEYIPGVEKGINSVMGSGVLAGFPVVDVKATLIDGSFHDVDSSVLAFELAARSAFREALHENSILLEPIMKVEMTTPEDYAGSVMGDLRGRGRLEGQDMRDNAVVINAMVSLANMFGYVNQLQSFSQGRANYTMEFSHYAPVPPRNLGPFPPAIGMRA
jgi:elongation factor G